MAYLAQIFIYPIKSLEPISVRQAKILPSGALEGDRKFAFVDSEGKFVNGKRFATIHRLRSLYDPMTNVLHLGRAESWPTTRFSFHIKNQREGMERWLGDFFGFAVFFRENSDVGFPDDLDCPGPTIISTPTLDEVASWFSPLDTGQLRLRIRANLELADVPAFWEDRLYTTKGSHVRFRIGDCLFDGNNPCQRCVVPPRDPFTGETYHAFAKIFAEKREETLPAWAERSRFNHFYRLAINTIVPADQAGKIIHVGDEIEVVAAAARLWRFEGDNSICLR